MESYLDNLRLLDRRSFFYLNDLTRHSSNWRIFFHFFAEYGIVLIVIGLIYLIIRNRINAFFAAGLAIILSTITSFLVYLIWQRPRPYVTYAEVSKLVTHTSVNSFPSGHTFLSFAIAMVVLLYGHKKLGVLMFAVAILIAVSRVATGIHYFSDVIGGTIIGMSGGILSYWVMESFERFWADNSMSD